MNYTIFSAIFITITIINVRRHHIVELRSGTEKR